MGKFCNQCGAQIPPDHKFCDECGAVVEAAPPVQTPPPPPVQPAAPVPPAPQPAPERRAIPLPYIIGAVVAVVAVIAAVVLLPGLLAGQPGSTGIKTTGTGPNYIIGDVVKGAEGNLKMVKGIHQGSGLYAYSSVDKQNDGTYYALDTLWAMWFDEPFAQFEKEYRKVDHSDPNNVVIKRLLDPSKNPPKYEVGDIVMDTSSGATHGFLEIVLDVDTANTIYTSNLVYKEKDGTYSTWYDEWRRPRYSNFQVFEMDKKKTDHVDPGTVAKKYASTELPVTYLDVSAPQTAVGHSGDPIIGVWRYTDSMGFDARERYNADGTWIGRVLQPGSENPRVAEGKWSQISRNSYEITFTSISEPSQKRYYLTNNDTIFLMVYNGFKQHYTRYQGDVMAVGESK
jgi:hypothetical protein